MFFTFKGLQCQVVCSIACLYWTPFAIAFQKCISLKLSFQSNDQPTFSPEAKALFHKKCTSQSGEGSSDETWRKNSFVEHNVLYNCKGTGQQPELAHDCKTWAVSPCQAMLPVDFLSFPTKHPANQMNCYFTACNNKYCKKNINPLLYIFV